MIRKVQGTREHAGKSFQLETFHADACIVGVSTNVSNWKHSAVPSPATSNQTCDAERAL